MAKTKTNKSNRATSDSSQRNKQHGNGALRSALKYILGGIPVLAIIGLTLNYKYHESEDLRNNLYRPLYTELAQIENAIQQNRIELNFSTTVKSSLDEKGEINRLPKDLRGQVQHAYADAASLIGNMGIVEKVERTTSAEIQRIRTKKQDEEWGHKTVSEMNTELMSKPGQSAIRSFEFKHPGISPGVEAHGERPKYVTPGALVWGFQDWVDYPDSVRTVDQLWSDEQFLIFDETREDWYFRITRDDLARTHLALSEFLRPIHAAISGNTDFKKIQTRRMEVKDEIEELRKIIADRIDDPKRLSDLLQ